MLPKIFWHFKSCLVSTWIQIKKAKTRKINQNDKLQPIINNFTLSKIKHLTMYLIQFIISNYNCKIPKSKNNPVLLNKIAIMTWMITYTKIKIFTHLSNLFIINNITPFKLKKSKFPKRTHCFKIKNCKLEQSKARKY